ncbi:MAG: hypothetical protein R2754_02810 [Microthrixaceae bacterium]
MARRWRLGLRSLPLVTAGVALLAVGCSGDLDAQAGPEPITVEPNESPVVAGKEHFLVSTGDAGRPTHLVRVGEAGQVAFPEDRGLISGTQLDDGSWFILNSSCQGSTGVCGDVGGMTIDDEGAVTATGELWDVPGTYEVIGSAGPLVAVSARTDTETTAWWVDTGTVTAESYAYRSAPYDSVAIRDAANEAGGTKEFDVPRFRFCVSDDWVYVLASPAHLGSAAAPSRVVEIVPVPTDADRQARLFEVGVDGLDAREAGALMCDDDGLRSVSVGPSADGGSEVRLTSMELATGEAREQAVASYDTPLVDLYGGGDDRALISVSDLGPIDQGAENSSEGSAEEASPSTPEDEPPSELQLVTDEGEQLVIGPQAPSGPAVLSLDGRWVMQPDGASVSITAVGG